MSSHKMTLSSLLGMENCLDLAIRTEGAVGNVAPTIEQSFSRSVGRTLRINRLLLLRYVLVIGHSIPKTLFASDNISLWSKANSGRAVSGHHLAAAASSPAQASGIEVMTV